MSPYTPSMSRPNTQEAVATCKCGCGEIPNKGREFIWGHQQKANAKAPRHKQLPRRIGRRDHRPDGLLDASKINQWLGEREKGRLKVDRPDSHARAVRNQKLRKKRESCTRRWLAWAKKHRRQWNEYRRRLRERKRAQTKQQSAFLSESVYTTSRGV